MNVDESKNKEIHKKLTLEERRKLELAEAAEIERMLGELEEKSEGLSDE